MFTDGTLLLSRGEVDRLLSVQTCFVAAELDAGAAFRFGLVHSRTLKIVNAMLEVRAKFLFHRALSFSTTKELRA